MLAVAGLVETACTPVRSEHSEIVIDLEFVANSALILKGTVDESADDTVTFRNLSIVFQDESTVTSSGKEVANPPPPDSLAAWTPFVTPSALISGSEYIATFTYSAERHPPAYPSGWRLTGTFDPLTLLPIGMEEFPQVAVQADRLYGSDLTGAEARLNALVELTQFVISNRDARNLGKAEAPPSGIVMRIRDPAVAPQDDLAKWRATPPDQRMLGESQLPEGHGLQLIERRAVLYAAPGLGKDFAIVSLRNSEGVSFNLDHSGSAVSLVEFVTVSDKDVQVVLIHLDGDESGPRDVEKEIGVIPWSDISEALYFELRFDSESMHFKPLSKAEYEIAAALAAVGG